MKDAQDDIKKTPEPSRVQEETLCHGSFACTSINCNCEENMETRVALALPVRPISFPVNFPVGRPVSACC